MRSTHLYTIHDLLMKLSQSIDVIEHSVNELGALSLREQVAM